MSEQPDDLRTRVARAMHAVEYGPYREDTWRETAVKFGAYADAAIAEMRAEYLHAQWAADDLAETITRDFHPEQP